MDVKRFWKQGVALGLFILVGGCSNSHTHDDNGGDPPDPPVGCQGFPENEPNDTPTTGTYLGYLPTLAPESVCGEWLDIPFNDHDVDYYFFYLSPPPGVTQFPLNMSVMTDPAAVPYVQLQQTIYDSDGNPTGGYKTIGTFYGEDGTLLIIDFPITYDFYNNNNLIVRLEGIYPLGMVPEYEMQYWY
jgi:hypothetical protein